LFAEVRDELAKETILRSSGEPPPRSSVVPLRRREKGHAPVRSSSGKGITARGEQFGRVRHRSGQAGAENVVTSNDFVISRCSKGMSRGPRAGSERRCSSRMQAPSDQGTKRLLRETGREAVSGSPSEPGLAEPDNVLEGMLVRGHQVA